MALLGTSGASRSLSAVSLLALLPWWRRAVAEGVRRSSSSLSNTLRRAGRAGNPVSAGSEGGVAYADGGPEASGGML